MTELKPCPFCGSKQAFIVKNSLDESGFFYIECDNCHASSAWIKEKEENINVWNNRQPTIDWRPINEIEHYFNLPMSEFYCLIFIDKKGNYYLGKDWEIANIFVSGFFDYGAKFDLNTIKLKFTYFAELTPPKS